MRVIRVEGQPDFVLGCHWDDAVDNLYGVPNRNWANTNLSYPMQNFLIDVDARNIVEPLLERVEDDVLALLEVVGRTRCLTLLADDLAQIGRERSGERRADSSDSGIRRKSQRCVVGTGPASAEASDCTSSSAVRRSALCSAAQYGNHDGLPNVSSSLGFAPGPA